jgi:hypothetical protein
VSGNPSLGNGGHENLCRALVVAALAAFAWIFLPLVPADAQSLGHDYSLFLPNLLAGYYWYLGNGPFVPPWFSPAQCGGVPFLADLNVAYYSFPQWAAFAVAPAQAVRATLVLFAALGAAGCYALLRARYAVTPAAAVVGAVLFLFSGFYAYRMAAGHLTFHTYPLVPWLAWAVLAPAAAQRGLERVVTWSWPAAAGGLILAVMFHAGMVHAMPVAAVAVAALLLVHGELHGHRARPWILLGTAVVVSLALSASRLVAAAAFLRNFPRADYSLPGFASIGDALFTAAAALFWRVSAEEASAGMAGLTFALERHEWEYGLGPAALVVLVAGAAAALARMRRRPSPQSFLVGAAIALLLALPLLLNWHEPHWTSFMKSLPYLGSSSNLVRWFALYIPVLAVLAALAFRAVPLSGTPALAAAAAVAVATIAWNAAADKTFYRIDTYDGRRIETAWFAARAAGSAPPITHVAVLRDAAGEPLVGAGRNDALTLGYSQLLCYQPMFGYSLERLPFGPLKPGPALAQPAPGWLNVKNPACYVYPLENACAPGGHFSTARRDDAERFLAYRPVPFAQPARQDLADAITLAAIPLTALFLFAPLFLRLRRR